VSLNGPAPAAFLWDLGPHGLKSLRALRILEKHVVAITRSKVLVQSDRTSEHHGLTSFQHFVRRDGHVVVVLRIASAAVAQMHEVFPHDAVGCFDDDAANPRRFPSQTRFLCEKLGDTHAIRSVGFFLFASALWALLPVVARRELATTL